MQGFVVGSTVPNELHLLQSEGHFALTLANVFVSVGEGPSCCRDPEGRQVPGFHEITPEAEGKLGNHSAVHLWPLTSATCSLSRFAHVISTALVKRRRIEPGTTATLRGSPRSHLAIQGVAGDNFDHRRELQDARTRAHVPFVEPKHVAVAPFVARA